MSQLIEEKRKALAAYKTCLSEQNLQVHGLHFIMCSNALVCSDLQASQTLVSVHIPLFTDLKLKRFAESAIKTKPLLRSLDRGAGPVSRYSR